MKFNRNSLVSSFFMVVGLFGIITSTGFNHWESKTLPLFTSSLVFVLALLQLVRDLRYHKNKEPTDDNTQLKDSSRWKHEIMTGTKLFSWSAAFIVVTYLAGFYLAIPGFSFVYLKRRARSWLSSGLFSVSFLIIIFLIFDVLLKTTLYKGLIFNYFFIHK